MCKFFNSFNKTSFAIKDYCYKTVNSNIKNNRSLSTFKKKNALNRFYKHQDYHLIFRSSSEILKSN